MVDWRAQQRCGEQGHPEAVVAYHVAQNGARHLCWWCEPCDRNVTFQKSGRRKSFLLPSDIPAGVVLDKLPEFRAVERIVECYWCHQPARCEWHHIAPKELYGKDADRFPLVPLCAACHRQITDMTRAVIASLRRGAA